MQLRKESLKKSGLPGFEPWPLRYRCDNNNIDYKFNRGKQAIKQMIPKSKAVSRHDVVTKATTGNIVLNFTTNEKAAEKLRMLKRSGGKTFTQNHWKCVIKCLRIQGLDHWRQRYQGTPNDNITFSPFERQAFHKDPNKLYIFWKLNNWRLRKRI